MFVWLVVSTDKKWIEMEMFDKKKIFVNVQEGKHEFAINSYEQAIIFYISGKTVEQKVEQLHHYEEQIKNIMKNNKYNMNLLFSNNLQFFFDKIKTQLNNNETPKPTTRKEN